MSTIIRDINGNRLKYTLAHYMGNCGETGRWHKDSTGLYCIDYANGAGSGFCAFIRPEKPAEFTAVDALARAKGGV